MDGYGNDVTATFTSPDLSGLVGDTYSGPDINTSPDPSGTAAAIAQIFSTGVTAYTDSQAIQRGYTIQNPRYYQGGYPGGVGTPYATGPQGASIVAPGPLSGAAGGSTLLLLLVLGVVFIALAKG